MIGLIQKKYFVCLIDNLRELLTGKVYIFRELDPRVEEMYTEVGKILHKYR
jgi:hypothetical protein